MAAVNVRSQMCQEGGILAESIGPRNWIRGAELISVILRVSTDRAVHRRLASI